MGRLGSLGIKVPPFLMAVSLLFSPDSHLERKEERDPSSRPMHPLTGQDVTKDSLLFLPPHFQRLHV